MSRIGKQPIAIPPKVKVAVNGQKVSVEGPKGKLSLDLHRRTSLKVEGDKVVVSRQGDDAEAKAMHGLSRALVNNMVKGVSEGFVKRVGIQGVGFKAAVKDKQLNLSLGYSHPILYPIPDQSKVTVLDKVSLAGVETTPLTIEGPDKHMVGKVASEIRSFYPPEPYKGKGVRYEDEKVVRKEGKTVQ